MLRVKSPSPSFRRSWSEPQNQWPFGPGGILRVAELTGGEVVAGEASLIETRTLYSPGAGALPDAVSAPARQPAPAIAGLVAVHARGGAAARAGKADLGAQDPPPAPRAL